MSGMRRCCDSVAGKGYPHIFGCNNYRLVQKSGDARHFVRMDNSNETILMDEGALEEFLHGNGLRLSEETALNGMAASATIQLDNLNRDRVGTIVSVGFDHEVEAI